jgi:hypothetical protein
MKRIEDSATKRESQRLPAFSRSWMGLMGICAAVVFLCLPGNPFIEATSAQQKATASSGEGILTGTGTIVDENIALARNEAISEAFVKAIEEYLIQRIGSQGMANNFQRLDEEILSKPKEAVQDYQIISEFRTERYVRVLVKVRVSEVVLEQKLKQLGLLEVETAQVPVLFMVSEKREGYSSTYWWGDPSRPAAITQTELSLSRVFEERGFRVINRSYFPPEGSYDEGMLNLALTDEQLVKWGELFSAQIVVAGEAILYGPSRASVFLRGIKVAEGMVIAQGYRGGIVDSTEQRDKSPIGIAITNWANEMIPHLMEGLEPAQRIVNRLIVIVRGLQSYGDFLLFKDFLRNNFPKITSVLERRLTKEAVTLGVETEGGSTKLAENLLEHPKRPFPFEIYDLNDQGFTVVVQ